MTGVYIIRNEANGGFYIGSSKNIESRIKQHMIDLRGGYHINKNIQSDFKVYDKYFTSEVIEVCSDYRDREQYYIDSMKPNYNVYPNSKSPAGSVWQKGHKRHRTIEVYKDDNFVGFYVGLKEVSEKLNIPYSSVSGVLYGRRNSVNGYKIKYII